MRLSLLAAITLFLACSENSPRLPERTSQNDQAAQDRRAAQEKRMAEYERQDSIRRAEHKKPLGPGVVDSAFAAAADSLASFVNARDSALALVKGDSGTPSADDRFFATDKHLSGLRRAWEYTLPNPSIVEWADWGREGIADSLERFLAPRSLRYRFTEGSLELSVDHGSLLQLFGPYLSGPLRRFLAIQAGEDARPIWEDGGVQLPWDSLAERSVTWEVFARENPRFARIDEARELAKDYGHTFITGTGNSPVFPYSSMPDSLMYPEPRESYERVAKRFRDTDLGRLTKEYLEVLQKSGFVRRAAVDSFYVAHGFKRL